MLDGGVVGAVVDRRTRDRTAEWLGQAGVRLPTFAELAHPCNIPEARLAALRSLEPDHPHPANLFRVHWYNYTTGEGYAGTPPHLLLPSELTGVRAPIVVALGCFFPLIKAHKVLAAYGCLVPRLVTGRFDPEHQRAVWPSTGNFCR